MAEEGQYVDKEIFLNNYLQKFKTKINEENPGSNLHGVLTRVIKGLESELKQYRKRSTILSYRKMRLSSII